MAECTVNVSDIYGVGLRGIADVGYRCRGIYAGEWTLVWAWHLPEYFP